MPAESKAQQQLFGAALAYRRGDISGKNVSKKVKELANSDISTEDIEDFASTKRKGLPYKKKKKKSVSENRLSEILREEVVKIAINEEDDAMKCFQVQGLINNIEVYLKKIKQYPNLSDEEITKYYERIKSNVEDLGRVL